MHYLFLWTVSCSGYWVILLRITGAFGSNFSAFIAQEKSMQLQLSVGLNFGEQTLLKLTVMTPSESSTFSTFLKTELENSILHFTYVIIFLNLQHFPAESRSLACFCKLHNLVCSNLQMSKLPTTSWY